MRTGILSLIGGTPLIKLERVVSHPFINLYAKIEALNPGGSIKDRTALNILTEAFARGALEVGDTVVESSSGNMGIGLAQACAYMGLKFICVVDPKTTAQNINILKAYGAQIEMITEPDPVTGEYLSVRIERVQQLLHIYPNSFWPDQYSNLSNPLAHHTTMHEIVTALEGQVDYLFVATSTCGTIRGCSEYIKQQGMSTKVIAVDAVGSIIFGGEKAKRLIPGHGAAIRPQLFQLGMAVECVHISDLDCVLSCRRLVSQEAILTGGSSGAVFAAFEQLQHRIPSSSNCVMIFADRGERYLDTIYSDSWVQEHFGDIGYAEGGIKAEVYLATA
ncbi:MAG: 2,3-diaminopropionate biosynthesis protein SbnA [Pyrinomonadaceae bacterium]